MIIDIHTHLYESYAGVKGMPVEKFVDNLKKDSIDQAWCFTVEGFFGNCRKWNTKLAELTKHYPKILIPFCTVDPRDKDVLKEMERCHRKLGMAGMKLHSWIQAFSPLDPSVPPIIHKCRELSWPIVFHDGTPPYASSFQVAHLASLDEDVKIILGHSGLHDLWKEALEAALTYSNIYLSTASADFWALKVMVKKVGAERILFGSDYPFLGQEMLTLEIEKIERLPISNEEREMIFSHNAQRILTMKERK